MNKPRRTAYVYLPDKYSMCFDNFLMVGISYVEDGYKIVRPNSDRNIIEYVIQGSGTLITPDGTEEKLQKGDVYYLPKGTDHYYFSDGEEQWAKIFINFGGDMFNDIIRNYGLGKNYVYHGLEIYDDIMDVFRIVKSKSRNTEIKCSSLIFGIICKMYNAVYNNDEKISDAMRIKNYIDKNFSGKIEIGELAALVMKSESQVIRIFKKEFGITPHKYIIDKKIEDAKILLRKSELSVKSISRKLSFADEFYFSNAFKKSQGVSPKIYREKNH